MRPKLGANLGAQGDDGWAALNVAGFQLNLHNGRKSPAAQDEAEVSFRADDFDATYAAGLLARGVKMSRISSPCSDLRCATFLDADGNNLAIEGR